MAVDLFAGIPVSDFEVALAWYERLLGTEPAFFPNDVEAVWELAEHRYVYVEVPDDDHPPGHGLVTLFVDDLDDRVAAITGRGLEPTRRETYENGVRKVTFTDPDGNRLGLGGGPA